MNTNYELYSRMLQKIYIKRVYVRNKKYKLRNKKHENETPVNTDAR